MNWLDNRLGQILFATGCCLLIAIVWRFVPHPLVVVVAGLAPLAGMVVLRKPNLFVLLFVVFSFFRIHEVFPQLYSLKIPLLLSLASLGALAWHIGFSRRIAPYWRPELTTLTVFFLLVTVGVIMASNRPVAIHYFKGIYWKIAIMTFAIAWLSRKAQDFDLASKLITFAGLMVGMVALFNKSAGIGLVEGTRVTIGRAIGSVLGDPNDLALVLMFPTSFAAALVLTQGVSKSARWLGMISVPILFFAIIATQSRGGLLGIISIFGIFGYRRIQSKALFMSLAVIGIMALYLLAGISDRASGGAAEAGVDASAMGRLYAWEAAFGMAVHNPFTGVGIDNFYSNYYYYSPHWDGLNHAVHSTWFGVLAETGFLGLAVFVTLIIQLLRCSKRTLEKLELQTSPVPPPILVTSRAVYAGLVGTVISGTFLTQGFTWPIYILAALVIAVTRWTEEHLATETAKNHSKGDIEQQ